jgi:predicted naringenin-chalcone synthase
VNPVESTLQPTIISLSTTFPELSLTQEELWIGLLRDWYRDVPNAERIVFGTQVQKRYFSWDPRVELSHGPVGTGDRAEVFERVVLDIGARSIEPVLADADRGRVGSFVMASCTGYMGPTPDLLLAYRLGLRSSLRRTFIGHMGCFAAFNVLKVATDSLKARPDEYVLANCTELCSLQFRPDPTAEQAVIHGLFGDASTSALIGLAPPGSGVQILGSHTEQLSGTQELMTWSVKNDGFFMTLSPYVPLVLSEHIHGYLADLLGPAGLDVSDIAHWVIHPGGPRIIEVMAKELQLTDEQTRASTHVLAAHGNCSSATVLMVLEEVLRADRPAPGDFGVMLAFGPGLTIEGMLIRF